MKFYSSQNALVGKVGFFFLALSVVIGLVFFSDYGEISVSQQLFLLLNVILFFYLSWEVTRITNKEKWSALIQPPVLASLYHFMLAYVVVNLRHIGDVDFGGMPGYVIFRPDVYTWMNNAMVLIILAAFAMWRGYYSKFAIRKAEYFHSLLSVKRLIRKNFEVNFVVLFLLLGLSIGTFFINLKLGVYGYSSEAESLIATQDVRGFLKLGVDLGPFVLMVLALSVFSDRYCKNIGVWLLFGIVFTGQVFLGFLSGFKSQVVWPVIITGFGYYIMKRHLPFHFILISFFMVMLAYQIVEPFREIRYSDPGFNSRSLSSVTGALFEAATDSNTGVNQISKFEKFINRNDLMVFTAISVAFKDKYGVPSNAPKFFENLILSPVLAFVPRLIWSSKPVTNDGHWFNINVLGAPPDTKTAVGMGPVSYCYFAGGYLTVFLIFYFIGFLQRILFVTFVDGSLGGWLIYLALLPSLVTLPSNIGGMLTGLFRIIPFVILVQYLVIKKKPTMYIKFSG